ncbi:MAG TPA: hypothetical protein VMV32_08280 [Ignavibacteriaceae bacterium]|nr:hypothetical protein [Ignavibacteriaceae bacterium]
MFIIIGFGIFIFGCIFFYKSLQFVLVAVNLYKEMIERQNTIIEILGNIEHNTEKRVN